MWPPIAGLDGVKEASLKIEQVKPEWSFLEGVTLQVAVAHGLGNAERVLKSIQSGEKQYHFVEVMACPGGCIGGGGPAPLHDQRRPRSTHCRHLSRGRGQETPQVARESRLATALQGVSRRRPRRPPQPRTPPHPLRPTRQVRRVISRSVMLLGSPEPLSHRGAFSCIMAW